MAFLFPCRILIYDLFNYSKITKSSTVRLVTLAENSLVPKRQYRSSRSSRSAKEKIEKLKFFSKLTGASVIIIEKCINNYQQLASKSLSDILLSLKTLEKIGIEKGDISKNYSILALSSENIRHRHASLTEVGFKVVKAPHIIAFNDLMKNSLSTLQKINLIPKDVDQFKKLLLRLNYPPELENEIYSNCNNYEFTPLCQIRENITISCLSFYLTLSTDDAFNIYNRSNKLSDGCLVNLKLSLEFLLENFDVCSAVITRDSKLLNVFVEDLNELKRLCRIFKLDFQKIIRNNPKFLLSPPDHVREICSLLIDFGVPTKNMEWSRLFHLHPTFIRDGLQSMKHWPEIQIFKYNPKFLDLLLNYKSSIMHMNYLRKAGYENLDVLHLIASNTVFQRHLSQHKEKSSGISFVPYLSEKLDVSCDEVFAAVRNHLLFSKVSVVTVRNNLSLLFENRFKKEQILRGLPVVLYPTYRVLTCLKQLPTSPLSQPYEEWVSSPNVLQLLLYLIERDDYLPVHLKPPSEPM